MQTPPHASHDTIGSTADADAALVAAALSQLRHLDDPTYTDRIPPTKAAWVQQVLQALRAAGATVTLPGAAAGFDAQFQAMQGPEARAALDRGFHASTTEMGHAALAAAQRDEETRRQEFVSAIEAVYERYCLALDHSEGETSVIVAQLTEGHRHQLRAAPMVNRPGEVQRQRTSDSGH